MGSPPPELSALVAALARTLAGAGIPFMLIGGQAVLVHGRPRLTEDIDVTLGATPTMQKLRMWGASMRRAQT